MHKHNHKYAKIFIITVIYYELLKGSSVEAQPVINYALKLIVTAVSKNRNEVNTLIVCARKILMSESQNVPTLHHICSFVIKNHIVSFFNFLM